MKLPERFRADDATEALHPEAEALLAAVDSALAGEVAPGGEGLAQLTRELHAERATPDPEFAAELDRWAAEGFPRAKRPGGERTGGALERLRTRLAVTPPRRLLAPAGAALTLIVVAGVAISQSGGGTDDAATSGDAVAVQEEQPVIREDQGGSASASGAGSAADAVAPPDERAAKAAPLSAEDGSSGFAYKGTAGSPSERKIAQTADLVLASEPDGVRDVADGVNEVVNRYRGLVANSSVQSGDKRSGPGAQYRLRIPAQNLQAALADLSELAHVRSRTETTEDITGRFISAQDRIEENEAKRGSLLNQLAAATTEDQADALEAQIKIVNGQLAAARADLSEARERVQLVPVTVSIVAEEGADDANGGDWGIDDAIDDAGKVLSTAAGVAVVAGAALVPVALIGLMVALVARRRVRTGRERALDE